MWLKCIFEDQTLMRKPEKSVGKKEVFTESFKVGKDLCDPRV